jgi:hypothetical protein
VEKASSSFRSKDPRRLNGPDEQKFMTPEIQARWMRAVLGAAPCCFGRRTGRSGRAACPFLSGAATVDIDIPVRLVRRAYFVETWVTTPWIACGPKCPVAGPVYTRLMLENETCVPPVMHT